MSYDFGRLWRFRAGGTQFKRHAIETQIHDPPSRSPLRKSSSLLLVAPLLSSVLAGASVEVLVRFSRLASGFIVAIVLTALARYWVRRLRLNVALPMLHIRLGSFLTFARWLVCL